MDYQKKFSEAVALLTDVVEAGYDIGVPASQLRLTETRASLAKAKKEQPTAPKNTGLLTPPKTTPTPKSET